MMYLFVIIVIVKLSLLTLFFLLELDTYFRSIFLES